MSNSKFKKCRVVMLSTDEASILGFLTKKGMEVYNDLRYYSRLMPKILDSQNQHLYIISDDKIEEGDWVYYDDGVHLNDKYYQGCIEESKKIIASTDQSLNLPRPSQAFTKKYVGMYNKGEKIEECLVEYEKVFSKEFDCNTCLSFINNKCRNANGTISCRGLKEYKHWKPKNYYEIPYIPKVTKGEITIKKIKDSWSREEVIELLRKVTYIASENVADFMMDETGEVFDVDNWIKQNL